MTKHTEDCLDANDDTSVLKGKCICPPQHTKQTAHTQQNWYQAKNSGNGQGLIIEEKTGRNVAVTYDEKDAPIIVRAVNSHKDLLEACKKTLQYFEQTSTTAFNLFKVKETIHQALSKAEGR